LILEKCLQGGAIMRMNILLVIALSVFSFNLCGEEVSKIIVKVNNQVITSRDLDEYCKVLSYRFFDGNEEISVDGKEFKEKVLEKLIEDTLILDKAKQEGIEIAPFRVENKIDQIIASHPTREDFEESLIEKGLTIALLRRKIEDQYRLRDIIDKHVRFRVGVSPKEISSYYLKHPDEFYSPFDYIFYIAKSTDRSILEKISNLIKKEGILQTLAKYNDMLIKLESNLDELRPEISKILEGLEVKKHKIAKVDSIFHLIFLEEKVFPAQLPLEEVKEEIHAYLWDTKFREKFNEWVGQLKEGAVIKNYYE